MNFLFWSSAVLLLMASLLETSLQQRTSVSASDFSCLGRSGGYYAAEDSDCRTYHLCGPGGLTFMFDCPPGTRFHQQYLVCDHAFRVDCSRSQRYFSLNDKIGIVPSRSKPEIPQKRAVFKTAGQKSPASAPQFNGRQQITSKSPRRPPFQNSVQSAGPRRPSSPAVTPANPFRAELQTNKVASFSSARPQQLRTTGLQTENQQRPAQISQPFSPQGTLRNFKSVSPAVFNDRRNEVSVFNTGRPLSQKPQPVVRRPAFNSIASQERRPAQNFGIQNQGNRAQPVVRITQKPQVDVATALLDLVGFSATGNGQQQSFQSSAQREPSSSLRDVSEPTSPRLKSILTQLAALGGGAAEETPLGQASIPAGSTFFRPRSVLTDDQNRAASLIQLHASSRPSGRSGADRGRQPLQRAAGWTPARHGPGQHDPRCPACLASLIVSFDACFPCVSAL